MRERPKAGGIGFPRVVTDPISGTPMVVPVGRHFSATAAGSNGSDDSDGPGSTGTALDGEPQDDSHL